MIGMAGCGSDIAFTKVNLEQIRMHESQIETARAEQKQAEENLVRLESEKAKRVSDREKLQKQMVRGPCGVHFCPALNLA
jgi:uncharacterized membrane protein (DUF106 family)